jgi:hypothetical protein
MFYVLKRKPDTPYEVVRITNIPYRIVKEENCQVAGKWGRADYARHWCDYYNNKINMDTLKAYLGEQ